MARDPKVRSLRAWKPANPVPPPDQAAQDSDPRIDKTRAQMEAMHAAFPLLEQMYDAEATDPTE